MVDWLYRCYGSSQPNEWSVWFDARNTRDQAKHDAVFDMLEQRQLSEWRQQPQFKPLKGGPPALGEVILTTDVAWRVFGYISGEAEFTVTGFGNHKDKVYHPKNIIETSRDRRKRIESGTLEARPCARPKTP